MGVCLSGWWFEDPDGGLWIRKVVCGSGWGLFVRMVVCGSVWWFVDPGGGLWIQMVVCGSGWWLVDGFKCGLITG